ERWESAAFERAWQQLLEHHAALRTSFHWEGLQHPVQVVHRSAPALLQQLGWSGHPAQPFDELGAFLDEDRRRGVALSTPPLLRPTLLRRANGESFLVWTYPEILFDGWSARLLVRDLTALYDGQLQGQAVSLGSKPRCRDYIAWLHRQDPKEAATFWR